MRVGGEDARGEWVVGCMEGERSYGQKVESEARTLDPVQSIRAGEGRLVLSRLGLSSVCSGDS